MMMKMTWAVRADPQPFPGQGSSLDLGLRRVWGSETLEGFILQMRPVQWGLEFEVYLEIQVPAGSGATLEY